jgi:hypothetical protein
MCFNIAMKAGETSGVRRAMQGMTKAVLLGGALLLAATPLCAETYKWVDEKGVTNYSSTPPPAKATHAKVIEDRISVIPSDPSFAEASAALRAREARRAEYAHAEWLQRQNAMPYAQAEAYAGYADCTYCSDYYPYGYASYFPAYFVARSFRTGHRGFAPIARPIPHAAPHRGIAMTRARGAPLR